MRACTADTVTKVATLPLRKRISRFSRIFITTLTTAVSGWQKDGSIYYDRYRKVVTDRCIQHVTID